MLGDVRAGEFGLEEPSGWIERFGIDPDYRGRDLGKQMFDAIVAHFREQGATTVRTMADSEGVRRGGLPAKAGIRASPLTALEIRLKA